MNMASHIAAVEASSRELERWRTQRGTSKSSSLAPQPSTLQPVEGSSSQRGAAASSVGSEPCLQRVWLEEAGLMLDDGCYNTVHQMLQQALKLAQVQSHICRHMHPMMCVYVYSYVCKQDGCWLLY